MHQNLLRLLVHPMPVKLNIAWVTCISLKNAWTTDDFKVSETMLNYFANFIKTGNPNGGKLPEWTVAKAGDANPPVMILDIESKTVNAMNDARYEFLDKAYKNKE